jgi:integrase
VTCVINDQVVLSQAADGPLAAHIGAFADSRTARGYARGSIQQQVRLAAGLSHWLKHRGVALSGSSVIALWLGHESVETTQIYLQATLAMKAKRLPRPHRPMAERARYHPDDQLLGFLNSL